VLLKYFTKSTAVVENASASDGLLRTQQTSTAEQSHDTTERVDSFIKTSLTPALAVMTS